MMKTDSKEVVLKQLEEKYLNKLVSLATKSIPYYVGKVTGIELELEKDVYFITVRFGMDVNCMRLNDFLKGVCLNPYNHVMRTNPVFPLEEVKKLIEERLEKIQHVLVVKGKEYTRNDDRFHNFNRTAENKRITPERALDGFLSKHITSYNDILDDLDKGILHKESVLEEKFGDILAYFILQEAQMVLRTRENNKIVGI